MMMIVMNRVPAKSDAPVKKNEIRRRYKNLNVQACAISRNAVLINESEILRDLRAGTEMVKFF